MHTSLQPRCKQHMHATHAYATGCALHTQQACAPGSTLQLSHSAVVPGRCRQRPGSLQRCTNRCHVQGAVATGVPCQPTAAYNQQGCHVGPLPHPQRVSCAGAAQSAWFPVLGPSPPPTFVNRRLCAARRSVLAPTLQIVYPTRGSSRQGPHTLQNGHTRLSRSTGCHSQGVHRCAISWCGCHHQQLQLQVHPQRQHDTPPVEDHMALTPGKHTQMLLACAQSPATHAPSAHAMRPVNPVNACMRHLAS